MKCQFFQAINKVLILSKNLQNVEICFYSLVLVSTMAKCQFSLAAALAYQSLDLLLYL